MLSTVRQLIFSGFFLDVGVKKLAKAFSMNINQHIDPIVSQACTMILVVVDSIFRFTGGGDKDPSLMPDVLFKLCDAAIPSTRDFRAIWR